MRVWLRFKDGSVRKAHFKISGDIMTFRVKVSSEGKNTETYLTEEELYTLRAGGMVTVEEVEKATGAPKSVLISDVLTSIASGEIEKGLNVVKECVENNIDAKVFLNLLLEKYRSLLLMKVAPNEKGLISVSEDEEVVMKKILEENPNGVNSINLLKQNRFREDTRTY